MKRASQILCCGLLAAAVWGLSASNSAAEVMRRPALVIQGSDGHDAARLREILQQRETIHRLARTWIDLKDYPKYGLVAIVGLPPEKTSAPGGYSPEDLERLETWLSDGGTILILWRGRSWFDSVPGKAFLDRTMGNRETVRDDPGDVTVLLVPDHPWTKHLQSQGPPKAKRGEDDMGDVAPEDPDTPSPEPTEAPVPDSLKASSETSYKEHPWLARSTFDWILPTRGERLIGTPRGRTALHRQPVGKGQMIYVGWSLSAGEEPDDVAARRLDSQMEILRRIVDSLGLYVRQELLEDLARRIGKDPFLWGRDREGPVPADVASWYEERGIVPEFGPASPDEELHQIRMDVSRDEWESTCFFISNYAAPREFQVQLGALTSDAGRALAEDCLRLRVQRSFDERTLGRALSQSNCRSGYGPIESSAEASAVARRLLERNQDRLAEPLWLFDLGPVRDGPPEQGALAVPRGEHVPIWITYQPRGDTLPGRYRGKLTVRADGADVAALDVEIAVRDVVRPLARPALGLVGDRILRFPDPRVAGKDGAGGHRARFDKQVRWWAANNGRGVSVAGLASAARLAGSRTSLPDALDKDPRLVLRDELPGLDFSELDSYLASLRREHVETLVARGPLTPQALFLTAIAQATGQADVSSSSPHYPRLVTWFLSHWTKYLARWGIQSLVVLLLAPMDDAGDRGPDLFRMQATSLLAAGLRPGSVFGEETVTRPERLAQLKPSVRAWCISENAISAFRMTDLFRNLDRSREEVLVSIPDGLNLPPFEARQRAWTALFPLISYGGRTSLLLGSDPDGPEPDLPVELDGRPVTCAALERLRDAVDDLLFYRYLQAEVVPALQPPQDAELLRSALGQIAGTQEGAMIRFVEKARGGTPRGDSAPIPHAHPVWDTDASNNDYRKAHAELLRLMERYGPRRQAQ